jgi:DnaK suppressor protein
VTDHDDLRRLIASERERAAMRVRALERDLDGIVESAALTPPDDEHDPEGPTVAFERAQVTTLLRDARTRLAELDLAGERLREGRFGTCERCGRPIPLERLVARPTARTCAGCAGSSTM